MKKRIKQAVNHPLISGSIVVFLGSSSASFLHFLFNLYMSRNLSVSDYGALASLLSLTTLFGLLGGAFLPTIVTFTGGYFANKEYDNVRGLFYKIGTFSTILGSLIFVFFSIFASTIGNFFHIKEVSLIPLVGFVTLLSYLNLINTALLQAKLDFAFLSFINLLSGIIRLVSGIFLISLGLKIVGALWAHMLSGLIPYLVTFVPLKFLLSTHIRVPHIEVKKIVAYGAPAAISLFCLTSFITTDIILVKHFFNPESAGIYAGVSLIGRIIFFLTAPIGIVMFPLVVKKHTQNLNYHLDFMLAMLLVFVPSLILIGIYFVFPELILKFSTREEYINGAPLLGMFGIFSTLYALLYLLTNFFLSIKKTNVFIPIAFGALLQIILIWFFHSTFGVIIMISIGITGLLLVMLLLYYWKIHEKTTTS